MHVGISVVTLYLTTKFVAVWPDQCEEPQPVANAYRTWEGGVVGSSVTYQCFQTYDLTHGNLNRTCHGNFTWTGHAPVCTLMIRKTPHVNANPYARA